MRLATYMLSGCLGGLNGALLAGYFRGASVDIGNEYLLASIAVVVIGGTSVAGGKANVPGIWGAALFMVLLLTMLNTYGASAGIRLLATGLIIIAVIVAAGGKKALRSSRTGLRGTDPAIGRPTMEASAFLKEVPLFADALDDDQLRFLAAQSRPAFFLRRDAAHVAGRLRRRDVRHRQRRGRGHLRRRGRARAIGGEARAARRGGRDVALHRRPADGDGERGVTNVDAIEITKSSLERVFAKAPELVDTFARVLAKRQAELSAVKKQRGEEAGDDFRHQARKAFRRLFRRQS